MRWDIELGSKGSSDAPRAPLCYGQYGVGHFRSVWSNSRQSSLLQLTNGYVRFRNLPCAAVQLNQWLPSAGCWLPFAAPNILRRAACRGVLAVAADSFRSYLSARRRPM